MSRPPRVFISRTTTGLKEFAEEVAGILRDRGIEIVIQTGFLPDWRNIPQMLQQQLAQSDAVVALIGAALGSEPDFEPARLKDERTHGRKFSYTQWEYLVARDLKRPIYAFILEDETGGGRSGEDPHGDQAAEDEATRQRHRQQQFIEEFVKASPSSCYWVNRARPEVLESIRKIPFELTVLAGRPNNLPFGSIGHLFKGRGDFLPNLRQGLRDERVSMMQGRRIVHGMGGIGKTRVAIEYAWHYAEDYNALLFVYAGDPEALLAHFAELCGPLILNLPEQDEKEDPGPVQVEAVHRWLDLHPDWLLILDGVDDPAAVDAASALFARLDKGHVLVTSRISDWAGKVDSVQLGKLPNAACIEFLEARTADRRPETTTDAEDVRELAGYLDGLALGLAQASAHISAARISYSDYISLWHSHQFQALAWYKRDEMDYPVSLAITYETSVSELSAGAKELFRTLAWFAPERIPRSLIDERENPRDERRHLLEIERLHLADYHGDGKYFAVHRINQQITRLQQEDPQPRALIAALDWIAKTYPEEAEDVRNWPTAVVLTPHAVVAANAAAERSIYHPSGWLLHHCGALLVARADYPQAEPTLRKGLEIARRLHGEGPQVAGSLTSLARVMRATGRMEEAERMIRSALALDEASLPPGSHEIARDLNNLAQLLEEAGSFEEAELTMRKVLQLSEAGLGECHPDVATSLSNLAALLMKVNKTAEAERMMRRALEIDGRRPDRDPTAVALRLGNLAILLQGTGRFDEAERTMLQATATFEEHLGEDHPLVAVALNNLGHLLRTIRRFSEAEALFLRALAIDEKVSGNNSPIVARDMSNLALLLEDTQRLEQAELLMRRALEIMESKRPKDHPEIGLSLNNLSNLLLQTGRFEEAEPMLRRALAIQENSFGANHPEVAIILNSLAQVLEACGQMAEAAQMMERHFEIFLKFSRDTGYPHPHLADAANGYCGSLIEGGLSEELAVRRVRAFAARYGVPL